MITASDLRAVPLLSGVDEEHLERLARRSADLRLQPGDYAAHQGDARALYIVLEGMVEVTKTIDGIEHVIGRRNAGEVIGEVPLVLGTSFPVNFRAALPARIMRIEPKDFHALAALSPDVWARVGALARDRIEGLEELAADEPAARATVVGEKWDERCHEIRTFLERNQVTFEWITPDDPATETTIPGFSRIKGRYPAVSIRDGSLLVQPETRELARGLGLTTVPERAVYDAVIIGGGPAGLAAAVYGASEGLQTLMIEREAPGGQAGTSSRIENYLGFPTGLSGDELASRALQQAKRFGAEILVTRTVTGLDPASRQVEIDGGEIVQARTIILATGVSWRRLAIEGMDRLVGRGVYYGAARSEAQSTQGSDIFLIGAGNSAGQAAMYFASYARSVTLVVRADSLEKGMSHYLIEQVRAKPNVEVLLASEVTGVTGDGHLESIDITDRRTGATTRHDAAALFVFIGADAATGWLPDDVARDALGFVLTGVDVVSAGRWPLARDPYLLETSVPGIFACGDVRCRSVKRVAAGVGEGSMAIAFVHQYLLQEAAAVN